MDLETLERAVFAQPKWSVDVHNFDDYFGYWMAYEPSLEAIVRGVDGMNLHLHMQSAAAKQAVERQVQREYQVTKDGIALFFINGMMMKQASSMSGGTSTSFVRRQLSAARRDPEVKGGLLKMDTPGGQVRGNTDLVNAAAAFAAVKPLYQFTEDLTASAGVSVASQATKRFANNATAIYGSMGTYSVLVDFSGEAEKLGIKVHVIRAGEFKGMGEPGTEITEKQLAEAQRMVNAMNENYLGLIARGLGKPLEMVRSLADGRAHTAADSVGMGLIDGVQSHEETYEQLVAAVSGRVSVPVKGSAKQTVPDTKPQSTVTTPGGQQTMEKITLAELKTNFPNSTAEWRETQLEAGATLADAQAAYIKHLEKQSADNAARLTKERDEALAAKKDAEEQAAAAAKGGGNSLGQEPLKIQRQAGGSTSESSELDPVEQFNAEVARVAGANATLEKRSQAIQYVARKNPKLHLQYLLACNPSKKAKRIIEEKMEAFAEN